MIEKVRDRYQRELYAIPRISDLSRRWYRSIERLLIDKSLRRN